MRKFKCEDCQHAFEVPHGQGGRGVEMTCPQCGSSSIFRTWSGTTEEAGSWVGRGRAAMGFAWGRWMGGFERGRGRGGRGRGRSRNPETQPTEMEQKNGEQV